MVALVCVYFCYYAMTYTEWHFIDNANLIFHEAGHTIFALFGTFIAIAAGSGVQIVLPLLIASYFYFTKQYLSGDLSLLWVGQNFLNVSVYAGDAQTMRLDLLGGEAAIHDWNYLLTTTGLIEHTTIVAEILHATGLLFLLVGCTLALTRSWSTIN